MSADENELNKLNVDPSERTGEDTVQAAPAEGVELNVDPSEKPQPPE